MYNNETGRLAGLHTNLYYALADCPETCFSSLQSGANCFILYIKVHGTRYNVGNTQLPFFHP